VSKTLSHLVFLKRIKFQKSCAGLQYNINRLIALIIKNVGSVAEQLKLNITLKIDE